MSQAPTRRPHFYSLVAQIVICLLAGLAILISMLLARLRSPGVDEVGGIALVYAINTNNLAQRNGHLAADVAEVLKKRVDPHGTRNLVWLPVDDSTLEIQIPVSSRPALFRPSFPLSR